MKKQILFLKFKINFLIFGDGMYSSDGEYGKVRLTTLMPPMQNMKMFTVCNMGWHQCNELYHMDWSDGMAVHLLMFTVKGQGILRIDGKEYVLKPGTIAFAPRHRKVSYFTPSGGMWEFYWIHPDGIAGEFLDELAAYNNFLISFNPGYPYFSKIEEMISLYGQRPADFELQFSARLCELLHDVAYSISRGAQIKSFSRKVIELIEQNFTGEVSLEELAKRLFVSKECLIRTFKKETGQTPHQYLIEYRLMIASQLLTYSEQGVEEIAEKTGFSSSSHFISRFRKKFGCTPLRYREQVGIICR